MDQLVTTEWLAANAGAADLRIVDATYFALEPERDARAAYEAGHLPGARFLDLETLCDADDPLPGMIPTPEDFARRMAALGIGAGDRVVLYDQAPHHTAARAWWLLQLFGVEQVALLDGDLAKWRAEGRAVETGAEKPDSPPFVLSEVEARDTGDGARATSFDFAQDEREGFVGAMRPALLRRIGEVRAIVADGSEQLLDARGAGRFRGDEADPRPGVAPGHMPGARNLPYGKLYNPDGTWKRGEALASEFRAAGIDLDKPVTTTCGSGVTASILLFGLALLGKQDIALYDGSWSEWGALDDTPKVTGA